MALLVLAGCATTADQAPPDQPPEYRTGFAGGCNSGYVAAGHPYYQFTKDSAQYQDVPLYKQGWDDGFAVCKGKYEHVRELSR